ncbi:hypothetical protein TREES_T100015661 [Tupaia chinensis]|uniref:Uncharacterized protein n=1 Tax=Tupaia chinensis TaxID=246437 RepID=L9L8J0_TUPCH|nr:hypothetical protein TREES_T100015661 [Tupaia chinensis]
MNDRTRSFGHRDGPRGISGSKAKAKHRNRNKIPTVRIRTVMALDLFVPEINLLHPFHGPENKIVNTLKFIYLQNKNGGSQMYGTAADSEQHLNLQLLVATDMHKSYGLAVGRRGKRGY